MRRVVLLGLIGLGAFVAAASPAAADRNFSGAFDTNINGQITMVANTLMTCPSTASGCAAARAGAANSNNDYTMVHVDADEDPDTDNSSSATMNLPAGATVLWAGLYWGADTSAGSGGAAATGPRNQVVFRVPGGDYETVTASRVDSSTAQPSRYQGFANVTDDVVDAGNGTYWVADVRAGTGQDRHAGWTLVIAYSDPAEPPRNLSIFDGFRQVSSGAPNNDIEIGVSGFETPPNGPVRTRLGAVAYEGDRGFAGDSFELDTDTISNPLNPASNFFNSSISIGGARVTAKNPDYDNQLGFDADLVDANGLLDNGQTSATISLTTGQETYFPGVVTFATELFAPDIALTKSVTDVNGGDAVPGDVLEYTVQVANSAGDFDAADDVVLSDAIPDNTSYEPGSLHVAGLGQTDVGADDLAEYVAGSDSVQFRVGTGANATDGGTLAPGASATATFRVRIDSPLPDDTVVANQATVDFVGDSTRIEFDDVPSNEVQTTVQSPDLTIAKSHTPDPFQAGAAATYTITVANVGDGASNGTVTVTDTLPDGFTPTGAAGDGWGCDLASQAVTCTRGDALAAGASYPDISITGTVSGLPPAQLSNTAEVSGGGDDNPSNDTVTDTGPVAANADLAMTKSVTPEQVNVGEQATYSLTVTNNGPATATGVTVDDDPLPAGLTMISASSTQGTCTGTFTCDIGTLDAGDSATITAVVEAGAGAIGTATNTASASADQDDPTLGNNSASADLVVGTAADLAITKDASSPTVVAGDNVTYTLAVTNDGPNDATGVTVEDDLPDGLALVSATPSTGTCSQSDPLTCEIGDLATGGSAQVTIVARATGQPGATVQNTASVSGDQEDPDGSDNQDGAPSVTIVAPPPNPPAQPDLAVTKRANTTSPAQGSPITYTITVENRGQGAATGVRLTDTPSGRVTVQSVSATQGTCARAVPITCELGTIAPGATVTVTTVLIPRERGQLGNTVSVTSAESESPSTVQNNQGGVAVEVRTGRTRVSVTKRASRRTARPNDRVSYRIVVRNRGTATARNLRVCDDLPSGLGFVSTPGARLRNGQACWTVRTLTAGRSRSFRVVAEARNVTEARRATNVVRVSGSNIARARARAAVRLRPAARQGGGVTG